MKDEFSNNTGSSTGERMAGYKSGMSSEFLWMEGLFYGSI